MSLINLSKEERGQLDQLNTEGIRASWRRGTSIPDDIARKIEASDESNEHHEAAKDLQETELSGKTTLEDDNPPPDVVRLIIFQKGSLDKLVGKTVLLLSSCIFVGLFEDKRLFFARLDFTFCRVICTVRFCISVVHDHGFWLTLPMECDYPGSKYFQFHWSLQNDYADKFQIYTSSCSQAIDFFMAVFPGSMIETQLAIAYMTTTMLSMICILGFNKCFKVDPRWKLILGRSNAWN